MSISFTKEKKEQLEYLLSLEKAAWVVGKSYENIARNYVNSIQDGGEAAEKFNEYTKIHSQLIKELENYITENVK